MRTPASPDVDVRAGGRQRRMSSCCTPFTAQMNRPCREVSLAAVASPVSAAGELQLQQRNDAHPSTSFSMSAGELLRTNCFHMHCDAVLDALVEHAASCARFDSKCERFPTSTICLRLTVVYVCEILLQKKILSPCYVSPSFFSKFFLWLECTLRTMKLRDLQLSPSHSFWLARRARPKLRGFIAK